MTSPTVRKGPWPSIPPTLRRPSWPGESALGGRFNAARTALKEYTYGSPAPTTRTCSSTPGGGRLPSQVVYQLEMREEGTKATEARRGRGGAAEGEGAAGEALFQVDTKGGRPIDRGKSAVQTRGLHPTAGNLNDEADPHPPNSKLQRSSTTSAKARRGSQVSSRAGRCRP